MSDVKDGGPAFPAAPQMFKYDPGSGPVPVGHSGMSLRDWFAGQALLGLLAHPKTGCKTEEREALAAAVGEVAYIISDAMLRARAALGAEK